ncbi:DUF3558 domain-containing protein [Allokutzneria sp. NRRL B-24872]|uniref:DUF3558 domain-containing protein n=1 Tax=Allokutzneria sp. NRRL B-24872 TaxID=1137961 RepID=UPI002112E596|nr:DUF3558 domain-containing protein [Allokutzneria sp. NRRL B-24872]
MAGCGQAIVGQPTEIVRSPDSTVPPPLTQPALSYESFLARSCDVLTREQLASIGIIANPGRPTTYPLGPACRWEADKSTDTSIAVTLLANGAGLGPIYKSRESGYFAEITIGGYPAVNGDNVKPVGRTTPVGMCFTTVGIAPLLAYQVQAASSPRHPDYEQPCKASDRVAAWVLEKLKTGT